MQLWTELIHLRVSQLLGRALFVTLLLITVLAGETSLRPAQAQTTVIRMSVSFSGSTPPISPGVICKDQDYQIVVRPMLAFASVGVGEVPLLHSIIYSLSAPAIGTLDGTTLPAHQFSNGGVAVFAYKANRTGQEILNFGWSNFVPPPHEIPTYEQIAGLNIIQGDTEFEFEVRECTYKVVYESRYQFRQGSVNANNFGLMAETQLERKEDGTLEGNGSFVITNLVTSQECVASYSDAEVPVIISGEVLPDSDEVEVNFVYRKGKYITDATCMGRSATTMTTLDVSGIAPKKIKTPQRGGARVFPLPGPGGGNLTITIKRVLQ